MDDDIKDDACYYNSATPPGDGIIYTGAQVRKILKRRPDLVAVFKPVEEPVLRMPLPGQKPPALVRVSSAELVLWVVPTTGPLYPIGGGNVEEVLKRLTVASRNEALTPDVRLLLEDAVREIEWLRAQVARASRTGAAPTFVGHNLQ